MGDLTLEKMRKFMETYSGAAKECYVCTKCYNYAGSLDDVIKHMTEEHIISCPEIPYN